MVVSDWFVVGFEFSCERKNQLETTRIIKELGHQNGFFGSNLRHPSSEGRTEQKKRDVRLPTQPVSSFSYV